MSTNTNHLDALAIEKLLATGQSLGAIKTVTGYAPEVVLPAGYTSKPLEIAKPLPAAPPPEFISGHVTLDTPEAFGAYVTRFKGPGTIIFWQSPTVAGPTIIFWQSPTVAGPTFVPGAYVARLDYHEPGTPARKAHGAQFTPDFTPELKAWLAINNQPTEQLALMSFIDEHMPEIIEPDGATLLEVARTLEIASYGNFSNRVERATEGRSLTWTEENKVTSTPAGQGEKIPVPEKLTIRIPVFFGVASAQYFRGKLIYEPKAGKLNITVRLLRIHEPILAAAAELHEAVTKAVGDVTMIEGEA